VSGIAALIFAIDPTIWVAVIAAVALVTGQCLNYLAIRESNRLGQENARIAAENREATKAMSINVDGNLKRLLDEKVASAAAHTVTSNELAHEIGHREGSDEERARDKP
jgi:fructose-1,6-bisphosphatase/sedoheptulose 1,7-bisphosphatase-like protein